MMNHQRVVEKALIHIENNLQTSLSVSSVADHLHLSKYYFHRLFSAVIGCSLNQYILSRRLNASLSLIQESETSLTTIAHQLNFGSQASFTTAFKRHYGVTPSSLRRDNTSLPILPVPPVVKRPVKNFNGDVVTDFTLTEFETSILSGIAFEVDLADDYKAAIRSQTKRLVESIDETVHGPCYVIYSNCQPDSTRFKAFVGIPQAIEIAAPNYFTVTVPQLFCAKFQYTGSLLDIGEVFISDFARFLKLSKQESEQNEIELIQMFDDVHQLNSSYYIYMPVKKLAMDAVM